MKRDNIQIEKENKIRDWFNKPIISNYWLIISVFAVLITVNLLNVLLKLELIEISEIVKLSIFFFLAYLLFTTIIKNHYNIEE